MDRIVFNCLLKSTQKPINQHLWLNILSAESTKKKVSKQKWNELFKKQTTCYEYVDDYLIEYILVFENGNGEKIKNKEFIYHAYLSEFANKEQMYIKELIKLRSSVKSSATTETVMAEVTVI
jgi:hypothetical protein